MGFESKLASRIAAKRHDGRLWKAFASFATVIFIVLTLTSSTLATPQAVIHLGTQTSVAKYFGAFDGHDNVVMLGALSSDDWVSIKVPFKGQLSDLESIVYSEFLVQTGDLQVEPYVVLKLPEGRYLVCHPESSYASGQWSLPYFSWQMRDTVSHGKWQIAPVETQSMTTSLDTWIWMIGDEDVISVSILIGGWELAKPYQCYLGDLAINGKMIDIANAGRGSGVNEELPLGF